MLRLKACTMIQNTTLQLRLEDLCVKAGPIRLLEDISLTLKSGEGLVLTGTNGSGKTSLLRTIMGLSYPEHGRVTFGNSTEGDAYSVAQNCHFIGHKNGLKQAHTVLQNLSFFADFDEQNTDQDTQAIIDKVAHSLTLGPLLSLPVNVLSAGQARRTAFARLLISPRPIWCLDEPTAALDKDTAQRVELLCQEHLISGGIIIAATHSGFLSKVKNCRLLNLGEYASKPQLGLNTPGGMGRDISI